MKSYIEVEFCEKIQDIRRFLAKMPDRCTDSGRYTDIDI